jgi:hypothetical protein
MSTLVKRAQEKKPNEKVIASPAKAFFVEMITRDIELQDAILDLLDNCVDGIRRIGRQDGPKPYNGYYAHITMSEEEFSIIDNCGGIPLEIAKKYAFMMGGDPTHRDTKAGMIGVYGIGMKRAIFKMGRSCTVHSHTEDDTFEVRITKEWLEDDKKWNLVAVHTPKQFESYGTRISVSDLRDTISEDFADGSGFRKRFASVVRDAFSLLLEKGFAVTVNGEPIKPKLPTLLWSRSLLNGANKDKGLRPYIYTAEFEGVDVFLAVGFRERPETLDDESEAHYSSEDAGWSVICNDRAVLSYDRSSQTGWGWGGVPSYHTQFIAITGFVIFEGHPLNLPMTTTKRGVDANSPLYTVVRERMQEGMKQFTRFTNDWKGVDISKEFEDAESLPLSEIQRRVQRGKVKLAQISRGGGRQAQAAPNLPKRPKESMLNRISFTRPIEDVRTVSSFLFEEENAPPSQVGAEAFDFVLRKAAGS